MFLHFFCPCAIRKLRAPEEAIELGHLAAFPGTGGLSYMLMNQIVLKQVIENGVFSPKRLWQRVSFRKRCLDSSRGAGCGLRSGPYRN